MTDNGPVENGESPNPLDMNGNDLTLANTSVEVFANISSDVRIKEADVSGTLMNAVKDNGDRLSIILIENIAGDKTSVSDLAGAMNLQSDAPSASVTYLDQNGNVTVDITTGVGISSSYSEDTKGSIGLIYGAVNEVVVYDQKSGNGYGVVWFCTLSDGTQIAPCNALKTHLKKLAQKQRALSRKQKFSQNWKKEQKTRGDLS